MTGRRLMCLLAFLATLLSSTTSEGDRRVHRLIGGHLRIFHEDPEDTDLVISASGSKDKSKPNQKGDDEEKKTLSQQVADGKYGLIQKELFSAPIKRPGVVSYESNPEVPLDNVNNLGGLSKNDIWLAENHLLVLKGGAYPPHDDKKDDGNNPWPAIDDYKAPSRQVKIPVHPKVPPPFPVQLTDEGPLQILGTNSSRTINGSQIYALPPPEGFEPFGFYPFPDQGGTHPAHPSSGQNPHPVPPGTPGDFNGGRPFPPFPSNGTLTPFFASLPPGAAILPPPPNQTEIDEDDPSIYYPPPYSFYYPKDNSSRVPAGPLVPGIILPPPPNFFGRLEDNKTTRKPFYITRNRVKTTTTPLPHIQPTTTPVPPTAVLQDKTTKRPVRIYPVQFPSEINNELKPITTTAPPRLITILPARFKNRTSPTRSQKRPPAVTILKPVKPPKYGYENEVRKPFQIYGPPKTIVSTTQVPLKLYYTTSNEIETNSITQPPEKYHFGVGRQPKTTTKSPSEYYYYEEQSQRTEKPKNNYYDFKPKQQELPRYIYVTTRPYQTQRPQFRFVQQQTPKASDTFSVHIARLQNQIHQYLTTPRPRPKPVYQFSFEAANYRPQQNYPNYNQQVEKDPQDKFRPLPRYSVQIQPAVEIVPTEAPPRPVYYPQSTERPSKYYSTPRPSEYDYEDSGKQNVATSRPISQFSFGVTQNPLFQGFYTKPDEYFDENTKQYFTTFGKKIQATTPIPSYRNPPQYQQQQQQQKPINLEGDTNVNYLHPRPAIEPNSEYIQQQPQQQQRVNYPQVVKFAPRPQNNKENPTAEGQPGSFISYQLPGDDGAHFYFLTPQLAQRRDQGAGFYYQQDNSQRIRRNNNNNNNNNGR